MKHIFKETQITQVEKDGCITSGNTNIQILYSEILYFSVECSFKYPIDVSLVEHIYDFFSLFRYSNCNITMNYFYQNLNIKSNKLFTSTFFPLLTSVVKYTHNV